MAKRKGQAALEFLTTYGWAILLLVVTIGALAYFGVLSSDNLLPEKCMFEAGIICRDFMASKTNNNVELTLINGVGKPIMVQQVAVTCDLPVVCVSAGDAAYNLDVSLQTGSPANYWKADEARKLQISATGLSLAKVKVKAEITYVEADAYFNKAVAGTATIQTTS